MRVTSPPRVCRFTSVARPRCGTWMSATTKIDWWPSAGSRWPSDQFATRNRNVARFSLSLFGIFAWSVRGHYLRKFVKVIVVQPV